MVLCFANEAATRKLLFIEPSRQAEENRLGKTFCSSSYGAAAVAAYAARPSGCAAVAWVRRGEGGAPHSWSNCCCVLCINRSHFQSENNLVVVANCACPLLSIHSNLRINWWSTDQNYDPLKYGGKKVWLSSWLLLSFTCKIWDYDHVTCILFLFKSILESMTYVGHMWSKL